MSGPSMGSAAWLTGCCAVAILVGCSPASETPSPPGHSASLSTSSTVAATSLSEITILDDLLLRDAGSVVRVQTGFVGDNAGGELCDGAAEPGSTA